MWRAKSCHFSGTKSRSRMCGPDICTTNGLRHGTQFGVPVREELVTVCVGCVRMQVVRGRLWREIKNIHITARIGAPGHSIVAPSSLTVYELFTKVARQFVVTLWGKTLNISKFSPRPIHALFHLTRIPTHPHEHCHEFFPHRHARLRAMA